MSMAEVFVMRHGRIAERRAWVIELKETVIADPIALSQCANCASEGGVPGVLLSDLQRPAGAAGFDCPPSRVQCELSLATNLPGRFPLDAKEPSPLDCRLARRAVATARRLLVATAATKNALLRVLTEIGTGVLREGTGYVR
jgi:hypothetical protein